LRPDPDAARCGFATENDWYLAGGMARELSAGRDAEAVGEAMERLAKATEDPKLHEASGHRNERIAAPEHCRGVDPLLGQA